MRRFQKGTFILLSVLLETCDWTLTGDHPFRLIGAALLGDSTLVDGVSHLWTSTVDLCTEIFMEFRTMPLVNK
jgi:hypothetical protein